MCPSQLGPSLIIALESLIEAHFIRNLVFEKWSVYDQSNQYPKLSVDDSFEK